jgi:hypothetical protein
MKLYLLPDIAPQSLLARFVDRKTPGDRDAAVEMNTLIGCIEPDFMECEDISANWQKKS